MSKRSNELEGFEVTSLNRRDLIKKALTAGGAVYVAPMILASAVPASAQGSPGPSPQCVGANCSNFIPNCSPTPNCFCWTIATGGGFCGLNFLCSSVADCGAGNTCPAGFVCAIDTCCVVPKCTPVSSLCPASRVLENVPELRGLTAAGIR